MSRKKKRPDKSRKGFHVERADFPDEQNGQNVKQQRCKMVRKRTQPEDLIDQKIADHVKRSVIIRIRPRTEMPDLFCEKDVQVAKISYVRISFQLKVVVINKAILQYRY